MNKSSNTSWWHCKELYLNNKYYCGGLLCCFTKYLRCRKLQHRLAQLDSNRVRSSIIKFSLLFILLDCNVKKTLEQAETIFYPLPPKLCL